MAKVFVVSTVTRDKVDNPDPWMELDSDCVFNLEGTIQIKRFHCCVTDSSDAEKRFSPHHFGGVFFVPA